MNEIKYLSSWYLPPVEGIRKELTSFLFPLFFFFKKIEVQLIYNVVLVFGIQQSDLVIHIYILFQILFYYKIMNIVPCAIQ